MAREQDMIQLILAVAASVFGLYLVYWLLVRIAMILGGAALLLGGGWLVYRFRRFLRLR